MGARTIACAGDIGTLIRDRRSVHGMTQPDLALAAGVGVRFVVDVERGKPTAQIALVLRLLEALGVGLSAAYPGDDPTQDGDTDG